MRATSGFDAAAAFLKVQRFLPTPSLASRTLLAAHHRPREGFLQTSSSQERREGASPAGVSSEGREAAETWLLPKKCSTEGVVEVLLGPGKPPSSFPCVLCAASPVPKAPCRGPSAPCPGRAVERNSHHHAQLRAWGWSRGMQPAGPGRPGLRTGVVLAATAAELAGGPRARVAGRREVRRRAPSQEEAFARPCRGWRRRSPLERVSA